jgi:hypothetical protein
MTGWESDDIDASFVGRVFAAAREWEQITGRPAPRKPLRELVWFVWQQPRLPRPLVRGKYPKAVPWTSAARDAYSLDKRCRLVIEHVEPINVLLERLLSLSLDSKTVASELQNAMQMCVMTPEEDKRLSAAGLAYAAHLSDEPWARYRAAGIDVEGLRPLGDA